MLAALGELLAPSVGVAISPLIVLLTIVLMASGRSPMTAVAFVVGAPLGVLTTVTLAYLLATAADAATDDDVRDGIDVLKLALGVLFIVLAVRTWHRRPRPGEAPREPKIVGVVSRLPWSRAAVRFALETVVAPQNVALSVGAGATLAAQGRRTSTSAVLLVVFAMLAVSTSALPLGAALVLGDRVSAPLDALVQWLVDNTTAIMSVLFALMSALFIGQGLGVGG